MGKTENRKILQLLPRYAVFIVGLFIASMGVAFSTKAGLGTSPVSSVPYAVSLVSPLLSFGGWLNLLSVLQITVQILVMRGRCNYIEIAVQTVLAFAYGYLTDLSCYLIRDLTVTTYVGQFALMLLGCFVVAFGLWVQLKGGVAMLPGEAMNRAIGAAMGKRYENVKIFFDVLYIAAAALICLVFLHRLEGVRKGSVIAAVLIGSIIKLYERIWAKRLIRRFRKNK